MSTSDNEYAQRRGTLSDESTFREQDVDVPAHSGPSPFPDGIAAGPPLFDLVRETRRSIEVQNTLLKAAIPLLNNRIVVEKHAGQTDANGNLDLVLYRVPQGFQFLVTRCVVEDATHTPGTPFAAVGAWHALITGDKFAVGSVRDFAPTPPLSNAACIPWIYSDGSTEASTFRGGEIVSLHVVGTATLANIDIFVTLQGHDIAL